METPQTCSGPTAVYGPVALEEDEYTAFFNTILDHTSSGTPSADSDMSDPSWRVPSSTSPVDLTMDHLAGGTSTTATTPLSSFDWSSWEDWAQWDGDSDLLGSPAPLAADSTASDPTAWPPAGGEAISPGSGGSNGAGPPLGRSHVLLSGSPQPHIDLTTQWSQEFPNLDPTGGVQLGTIAGAGRDVQWAQSPQDSPLNSSDSTGQYPSSTSSEHWSPTAMPLLEPNSDVPSRKRKSFVGDDIAGDDIAWPAPVSRKRPVNAKAAHKMVEKRYRTNLNEKIDALRDVLPGQNINKAKVLSEALDYIRQLEEHAKTHAYQMTIMKVQLDVFKTLAAARSSEAESGISASGKVQEPPHWGGVGGVRGNPAAPQSPTNNTAGTGRRAPAPARNGHPVAGPVATTRPNTGRGGYVNRLLVGSLASLMVLQGLGESEQAGHGPGARGLFSLPADAIWHFRNSVSALWPSNASQYAPVLRQFSIWYRIFLFLGAVIYMLSPTLFDSTAKGEGKPAPQLALESAPLLGSPVAVRRNAWLTATQTVWVPPQSILEQLAALLLTSIQLIIRKGLGQHRYATLTGITKEQEVTRDRAWDIALDAQLTGGDSKINLYRLALTILASATLPETPYRLMRKALHIYVLTWDATNNRLYGQYLYRNLVMKFARHQWQKARELQSSLPLPSSGSPDLSRSEALPGYLAGLLELDIDAVMQDSVVQRVYNLAWDRPTDEKALDCINGMNTVVNDPAIGSPLDALSAWVSCTVLHKALASFLGKKTGVMDDGATFRHDLNVALKIAPTGSLVQSYALVARAVLLSEHRGTNIAAALQSLPALSQSGARTPTMAAATSGTMLSSSTYPLPPPELKLALQCAMTVALLKSTQHRQEAVALMRAIRFSPTDFGLLGSTAAYQLLHMAFRDKALAGETRVILETVSGALKLWTGGKQGSSSGLSKGVKCEIATLSVDVLSWLVGLRDQPLDDPGYGSMSDG